MRRYRRTKLKSVRTIFREISCVRLRRICLSSAASKHPCSKVFTVVLGERCLVWKTADKEYLMEFDVSIGKKTEQLVKPVIVFDAKIELDSSRLKTALASFVILKRWNREARCFLVYVNREVDSALIGLAKRWIDRIFNSTLKKTKQQFFLTVLKGVLVDAKYGRKHGHSCMFRSPFPSLSHATTGRA